MTRILAIDPGLSGAYAVLSNDKLITVGDLPRLGEGSQARISGALFAAVISEFCPVAAVIESVAAMPKQGVSSTFRFGRACGCVEGIVAALGLPIHYAASTKWKLHFRLPGKTDQGAEAARQRAIELWPGQAALFARKKDHNRAEAALIGLWFSQVQPQSRADLVATSRPSEGALERSTAGG